MRLEPLTKSLDPSQPASPHVKRQGVQSKNVNPAACLRSPNGKTKEKKKTKKRRLRQDRVKGFSKKKKESEGRDFAAAHAVSEAAKTRGKSLKSCCCPHRDAATTQERRGPSRRPTRHPHPPRDTHLAVTPLLALICSSLHSQVFNLSFKISESVLVVFVFLLMRNLCLCYFSLAFWLCDYLTDESVFVFVNCDSV